MQIILFTAYKMTVSNDCFYISDSATLKLVFTALIYEENISVLNCVTYSVKYFR